MVTRYNPSLEARQIWPLISSESEGKWKMVGNMSRAAALLLTGQLPSDVHTYTILLTTTTHQIQSKNAAYIWLFHNNTKSHIHSITHKHQ